MPNVPHSHAAYRQTPDGRFTIYKHLHLGTVGFAGTREYWMLDQTTGRASEFHNLDGCKCLIAYVSANRATKAKHSPLFPGCPAVKEARVKLVKLPDYAEIIS